MPRPGRSQSLSVPGGDISPAAVLTWREKNALLNSFSPQDKVFFFFFRRSSVDFLDCLLSSVSVFLLSLSSSSSSPPACLSVVRPSISPVYSVVIQDNMFQHLPLHMMPDPRHWPSLNRAALTHISSLSHFSSTYLRFSVSLFILLTDHPAK